MPQVLTEALNWLKVIGIDVAEAKFKIRCLILTIAATVVVTMEGILIAINISNVNIWARVLEAFAPMLLSLIKVLMLYTKRNQMSYIIKTLSKLWPTSKFNPNLGKKLEHTFTRVKNVLSAYRWYAITTTSLIVPLKPILTGDYSLPVDMWQPFDFLVTPQYEFVFFFSCCGTYFATIVNVAIDSVFVAFMTHLICQFKLLEFGLRNLMEFDDERKCWKAVQLYVEYHNNLLNLIESIQSTHSMTFIGLVGVGTISLCIDMFSVAYDEGTLSINRLVRYIFQGSFFMFLLFAYCFASHQLTYQFVKCFSVADAVYESEWYCKQYPRVHRAVILIIQRSQKTVILTAGGLIILNLENFLRMLRLAFSFFTLIRK